MYIVLWSFTHWSKLNKTHWKPLSTNNSVHWFFCKYSCVTCCVYLVGHTTVFRTEQFFFSIWPLIIDLWPLEFTSCSTVSVTTLGNQDDEHSMRRLIEQCVCDLKQWMTRNKLRFNDDKTELLIITSKRSQDKIRCNQMQIGTSNIEQNDVNGITCQESLSNVILPH